MSSFFSMVLRMKYINRWGLMRNTRSESLSEHSLDVALIAHALALIGNKRLGRQYDADHLAVAAMYHDVSEIITGDLPTPVKYHDERIRRAYKDVESAAVQRLLRLLPDDLQEEYSNVLALPWPPDSLEYRVLKAADKLSALIKCLEEERSGNLEFTRAKFSQLGELKRMDLPEANIFIKEFLPSFTLTLDEQE